MGEQKIPLIVKSLLKAADLNPNDPTPYLFLGQIQNAETPQSELLTEKLKRFVRLQPENAMANYYYAVGLWKLRKASHVDINSDYAYVVVPANYTFEQKGKAVSEVGSIITLSLQKSPTGWRITGWAWAKR